MYKIYKHTLPDGRAYVGMTGAKKVYKRWCYGAGYVNNKPFYQQILQIGWNNIQHEILEEVETKEEARELELYYMELFETYLPEKGFNTNGLGIITNRKKIKYEVEIEENGMRFATQSAAAEWLGITKQAVSIAIKKHSKVQRQYHLRLCKVKT